MLYSVSRKQFIHNALSSYCTWTDIIRDSKMLDGKYYFDESDIYYLSVNYGGGETITVFNSYSDSLLEKAQSFFPNAKCIVFACQLEEYNNAEIKHKHGIVLHYKFIGAAEEGDMDITVREVDESLLDFLKIYDSTYLSFLPENHGARLMNHWSRYEDRLLNGDEKLYLAWNKDDTLIGFVMMDIYKDLSACDISQITIEDPFKNRGYGNQLLRKTVNDLKKEHYDIYYSSVNSDNIISQKTAESAGFKAVACKISIVV